MLPNRRGKNETGGSRSGGKIFRPITDRQYAALGPGVSGFLKVAPFFKPVKKRGPVFKIFPKLF